MSLQRTGYAANSTTEIEDVLEVHAWQVCVAARKNMCQGAA